MVCLRSLCTKRGNTPSRCFRVGLLLFTVWIAAVFLFWFDKFTPTFRQAAPAVKKRPTTAECVFPNSDPFSPALNSIVKKYPPLNCSTGVANVVYLQNYTLIVDQSKLAKAISRGQRKFSHCHYREVKRKHGSDKKIEYTWSSENFTKSIPLPLWHDNVVSECFDTKNLVFSRSYFPLIRKKPEIEELLTRNFQKHLQKNSPAETLSIFMIGIDGMSKQNFERSMPKTKRFLLDRMGAIELHKYNKLGYSTIPNVISLLTGRTLPEFHKGWNYQESKFVDQINEAFLWSDARKIGYRTGLILDCAVITAFHYQKMGFNATPVDYYQRPTVIASNHDKLMREVKVEKENCIGDMPEVTQIHDYWLQMARTFGKNRSTPFFAYSFAARLTHDFGDWASKGDEHYLKFLQDLVATEALEDTLVIWFSDHGPRFTALRKTYQGKIETNTPYMFLSFPTWFKLKYPELMETLKTNQHRLATHFDVYETVKDIFYFKRGGREKGTLEERGISLFREIPKERTCADAAIPSEFCACGEVLEPEVSQETRVVLGLTILNKINSFVGYSPVGAANISAAFKQNISHPYLTAGLDTSNMSILSSDPAFREVEKNSPPGKRPESKSGENYRDKCARLYLSNMETLYQIKKTQGDVLKEKTYRVTIKAEPGLGLFEGLVSYTAGHPPTVQGDVVRLNMYRGQADCVHDPWLRQFCFCHKRSSS